MTLRALAGMDGLTTGQVADLLGLTWAGAAMLMGKLQATDGVPMVRVGGQWIVQPDQLIVGAAGQGRLEVSATDLLISCLGPEVVSLYLIQPMPRPAPGSHLARLWCPVAWPMVQPGRAQG